MVHPYWESVCLLVNRSRALSSGIEIDEHRMERERSDMNYRLASDFSSKTVTGMRKAIRWAINSGIFVEMHSILVMIEEEASKIMTRRVKTELKNKIERASRRVNPELKPKKAFCEDTILSQIWDYSHNVPTFKKSDFVPQIGIELECEKAPYIDPYPGWDNKSDGSLGDGGREYISPPIDLDEGMVQFRKVVDCVRKEGAIGRPSCGLHVHVGIDPKNRPNDPWSDEELREKENMILDYINSKRDCPEHNLIFTKKRYEGTYSRAKPNTPDCRYSAVNFHSMRKHGTVEIRFFAVCPNLSDEWVEQFERTMRYFYDILSGNAPFHNRFEYQGLDTFSFQEVFVNSDYCDEYWSNWENVTAHLASL
jgi:hypothetical protein